MKTLDVWYSAFIQAVLTVIPRNEAGCQKSSQICAIIVQGLDENLYFLNGLGKIRQLFNFLPIQILTN